MCFHRYAGNLADVHSKPHPPINVAHIYASIAGIFLLFFYHIDSVKIGSVVYERVTHNHPSFMVLKAWLAPLYRHTWVQHFPIIILPNRKEKLRISGIDDLRLKHPPHPTIPLTVGATVYPFFQREANIKNSWSSRGARKWKTDKNNQFGQTWMELSVLENLKEEPQTQQGKWIRMTQKLKLCKRNFPIRVL